MMGPFIGRQYHPARKGWNPEDPQLIKALELTAARSARKTRSGSATAKEVWEILRGELHGSDGWALTRHEWCAGRQETIGRELYRNGQMNRQHLPDAVRRRIHPRCSSRANLAAGRRARTAEAGAPDWLLSSWRGAEQTGNNSPAVVRSDKCEGEVCPGWPGTSPAGCR